MALFQSLESRYGEAVQLNQALQGFLRGSWDAEYTYNSLGFWGGEPKYNEFAGKQVNKAQQELQKKLNRAHDAYTIYWNAKKKAWFFQEWWSYIPWSVSRLNGARRQLKKRLAELQQAHTKLYQTIEAKSGIGTALLSNRSSNPIIVNQTDNIDYCISRYRNGDPNYKEYESYYKRQIALAEIEHRFFTSKGSYLYIGLFFVMGLLGVGLAVVAVFWPPAMALLIGGKVGLVAFKIASILLMLPAYYGASAFGQWLRECLFSDEGEVTQADWHGNHVLVLDIVALVATLMVTVLPLFYIMTLPHGHLIAIILVGSFSALGLIQATVALLDPKRRVDYLGSGLMAPVGQGKEAINLKRSLGSIFSFSAEHRRHLVKFLLNPAEWLSALVDTVQSLCLRICEIGTTQGTKSSLLGFKVKQNIILVVDFFMSPVRLVALVIDAPLRFIDFTREKFIDVEMDPSFKDPDEDDLSDSEDDPQKPLCDAFEDDADGELTAKTTHASNPSSEPLQSTTPFRWLFDPNKPHSRVDFVTVNDAQITKTLSNTL